MINPGPSYRCDIIVVTWNKLNYIKECVESVLKYTDVKSRLIIVDNASENDTKEYLKGLTGTETVHIKIIFNDKNLGPGKGRNIALKIMDADYVCFVDSDVKVSPGWLSTMIALADGNSEIGMLNPSSNNFNQVPPDDMPVDRYAVSLAPFKKEYIEVGQCISFCMLIKAEVVRTIGFIDEDYILAMYEDTDYSRKASAAGYLCAIAKGAYVWHYGHGSTGRVRQMDAIAEKNKARFYKKWGRPLRIFWGCTLHVESEAFREALISAIELAREGNFIYINAWEEKPFAAEEIFKKLGLVEHADVHIRLYRGRNFKWLCLWRVLIKRKKKYDIVITNDKTIASLIKKFRLFHAAEVIGKDDFELIHGVAHRKKFEEI